MLRQYKLIRISNKLFLLSHYLRKQNSWKNSSKILCLTKTMGIYVLKGLLKKLFWVALSIQNKNTDSWLQKKKQNQKNLRYLSDQNIKANIQGTNLTFPSPTLMTLHLRYTTLVTTIPETKLRRKGGFFHC